MKGLVSKVEGQDHTKTLGERVVGQKPGYN